MFTPTVRRLIAGTLGAVCAAIVSTAQADPIVYRQSVMKVNGGHMGAMAQIVGDKVPHGAHLLAHAQGLATSVGMVKEAFMEKANSDKSAALDEIWSDWDGFAAKADDAQKAADALVRTIESNGDVAAARKELGAACGACHKAFRQKQQ